MGRACYDVNGPECITAAGATVTRRQLLAARPEPAVITEGGCELITRGVAMKADEIEALIRG